MSQHRPVSEDAYILNAVTTRAAVDATFRHRLLTDPNAAVSEIVGEPVPSTLKVKFIEKDPDLDALVVLPDFMEDAAELSAEELETVAGGCGCFWSCIVSSVRDVTR